MVLARCRKGLCKKPLAGKGRIASPASIAVAAHVSVGVTDVVFVFLAELLVCDEAERAAPELYAVFQGHSHAFEEQRVLEAPVMFEMSGFFEGGLELGHAEGEVL